MTEAIYDSTPSDMDMTIGSIIPCISGFASIHLDLPSPALRSNRNDLCTGIQNSNLLNRKMS
jgi:hypothetical protein